MSAIGGGPNPEDWKKMTKEEKITYIAFVVVGLSVIAHGIYIKFLS
ncbi:hypothetical protein [Cupriavidus pampae]|uniref:Light-harvesting protein n=1 Tax=Cupriavidus pampae TaxID=659251 RepID=A0ABM8WIE9_9BURK|nr:hypothetical protein [Cupriavidus pampae]CAG9166956.1 hypothetical protein LMG32289_01243 [Cupriavidus pampae]